MTIMTYRQALNRQWGAGESYKIVEEPNNSDIV